MSVYRLAAAAAILILCAASLPAQSVKSWKVEISGRDAWKDTGVDVQAGDLIHFAATGTLKFPDARAENGPDGLSRGWMDIIRALPMGDQGRGALIGRIGDSAAAQAFFIGSKRESRMPISGRLYLGTNQARSANAEGTYTVSIELMDRAAETAQAEYNGPLAELTKEQWSQIPYRVTDPDGTEGDLVNFLIFGSEDQMKSALLSMGWVIVDKSIKDTIFRGGLGTFSKQAYVTIPMSPLTVFGRVQDYGWARSDPIMTVAERHHFRVWKAPFEAGGQQVWVGAGTHDVGFDRDQRNGKLTHKIDPNVDLEREFIGESLKLSGQVVKLVHHTREKQITEAKTAHGQEFHSDGRVLLIHMKPDQTNVSSTFADYFCSVLAQSNPDGGEWGECSKWLNPPGKADMKLDAIPNQYRLLVIPGIMNTCVSGTPAYEAGRKYLQEKYGIQSDIIAVPNSSSEDNAKVIAEYLKENGPKDAKPFIVLGYSKGTPDLQVMLATEPEARKYVAAFISVAGASGGSPIADAIPEQLRKYGGQTERASCKGDMTAGMNSLKRDVRQRFLHTYPHPFVRTYSLPAVMDEEAINAAKMSTAKLLSTYDKFHDGQVLKTDAMIPESFYLGSAKSDHLSVALAFEQSGEGQGSKYPRSALLEALVRFVVSDLGKNPPPANAAAAAPAAAKPKTGDTKPWAEGWSQKKK